MNRYYDYMRFLHVKAQSLKRTHTISLISAAAMLSVMSLISGCSSPDLQPITFPEVANQSRFSQQGSLPINNTWWREFNDPSLNHLVEEAFRDNLTLAQSWSRLARAAASLDATASKRIPSFTFNANARRQWQNTQIGSRDDSTGSTLFNSSYELDLWGKINAQYESAYFDYLATEQDLQTAAITLAGQITNNWFSLTEKRLQRELLIAQYQNAEQTLASIKTRFNNGNRNGTDLLQQERVIESRKAALILNESEISTLEHSLALLIGKDPSSTHYSTASTFPLIPPFPALGFPAETLSNRPDMQSAWLAIQSADANVAAAIANRFPAISLGGSLSAAFGSPINLFENWIKSISANLSLPLLDGGARRSEVDRKRADLELSILSFQSTTLNAIKEVEDAIVQEKQQRLYLESLQKQIKIAEQVFEQTLRRYQNGNQSYLQVLTAQDALHALRQTQLSAKKTLLSYRVALYRAIGGGFELSKSQAWQDSKNVSVK